MARDYFSVPIYFIVFRETLEAAIIVSVLLGLVEQIVYEDPSRLGIGRRHAPEPAPALPELEKPQSEKPPLDHSDSSDDGTKDDLSVTPQQELPNQEVSDLEHDTAEDDERTARVLVRKMRIQIFLGAGIGLLLAASIGAAFIAVWFTEAADLWTTTEDLWEGIFDLIAAIIILVMGVTMLKIDRAKAKWRIKLQRAFSGQHVDRRTRAGRWVLLVLPLITVLREGIEAVVFVGGVSLGESAISIPIAAICGLITGLVSGYLIYAFASRSTLTIFMIVMTNFILLIGAGLFSKAIWSFSMQAFDDLVGSDVDDTTGDGPGSFDVRGSVWHLDCCNPENTSDNDFWTIFNAVFGWENSATLGSVISYALYWFVVMCVLVCMKYKEGRTSLFGYQSAAGKRRKERAALLQETDGAPSPEA